MYLIWFFGIQLLGLNAFAVTPECEAALSRHYGNQVIWKSFDKNNNFATAAELYEAVMQLEQQMFPGFFPKDGPGMGLLQEEKWKPPGNPVGYSYFAPSWYFNPSGPLISLKVLKRIREGATVLSVGAGPAFLETFLLVAFDLKPGQITLSDIASGGFPNSADFKTDLFDMLIPWPKSLGTYDFVLFPESVFIHSPRKYVFESPETRAPTLANLMLEALKRTNPGGESRFLTAYNDETYDLALPIVHRTRGVRENYDGRVFILSGPSQTIGQ